MRTKLILAAAVALILGLGGWKAYSTGSENATLRAENTELRRQNEIYRDREEKIAVIRAQVKVCKDQISKAQLLTADWQAKYDEIIKRPPEVVRVEVPVGVVPDGTPCEAGLAALAAWVALEAQHGRIR